MGAPRKLDELDAWRLSLKKHVFKKGGAEPSDSVGMTVPAWSTKVEAHNSCACVARDVRFLLHDLKARCVYYCKVFVSDLQSCPINCPLFCFPLRLPKRSRFSVLLRLGAHRHCDLHRLVGRRRDCGAPADELDALPA